ncbi:ABC transporter ATP-binding protein/permease [Gluconacetobacter tumulicola]|uniref:ATP-binding cassette domain-containing protein n=1 Tax=Gluconacetobacter tumulicola TaxID=1017177 RepID=A0A7W4PA21_9PROT|nr:ATP-binding cassette domain-containing protein [Gluconacetobacter tumulicola]MBB2179610.1 ATP-binding cassette domain-containing protein [Gluconacetobacter tumulicola]
MRRMPGAVRVLACLLGLWLLAPFLAGLLRLGDADWSGVDRAALARAAGVSVASASLATLLIGLFGIPLGYVLARGRGWWTAWLGGVVQLPLALPPLAGGVLLLFLLGYGGPLGALGLSEHFAGIVAAEMFVASPFLIIAARSAFAAIDPALEDVAATLGHRPGAIFRRVSLPLAWRPILAGLVLAWLRAFGEFGATVMLAYHPYSLPVFTYVAFGEAGLPSMLPVLAPTLVLAALAMAVGHWLTRPVARGAVPRTGPLPPLVDRWMAEAPPRHLVLALRRALPGFTLDVRLDSRARRIAILGPSGSGKSMTLRAIAGLEEKAGTQVLLDGRDLSPLPPEQRAVAYVPQGYALPPHLTVARQVRFAVDCVPDRAAAWMAALGLEDLAGRYPDALSPGQRQRVALARAFARRNVDLVLLDEPFSALDAPLRARLRREVLAVLRGMKVLTVLVTHDPAEALAMAEDIVLLDGGRVIRAGPAAAVFARPGSELAARLLGAEAIGDGVVRPDGRIYVGQGVALQVRHPDGERANLPPPGARVRWSARPYQIRPAEEGAYPARILWRGPIQDGQRPMRLLLGDAELEILADPSCMAEGACRVDIDPACLQVWPVA